MSVFCLFVFGASLNWKARVQGSDFSSVLKEDYLNFLTLLFTSCKHTPWTPDLWDNFHNWGRKQKRSEDAANGAEEGSPEARGSHSPGSLSSVPLDVLLMVLALEIQPFMILAGTCLARELQGRPVSPAVTIYLDSSSQPISPPQI